jgi:hemerythrin-like domain-containing protein
MMEFSRRTAQLLHEEHRATIAMIEGLENMIARAKRTAPDVSDPEIRKILEQVNLTIEQDVRSHFAFEEAELFTRLAEFGDSAIGDHLTDEHRAMLPLAEQVATIATASMSSGFSDQSWTEFKGLTGELIERMLAHIQKEEMALLPMLEELLDPETDMELAEIYSTIQ